MQARHSCMHERTLNLRQAVHNTVEKVHQYYEQVRCTAYAYNVQQYTLLRHCIPGILRRHPRTWRRLKVILGTQARQDIAAVVDEKLRVRSVRRRRSTEQMYRATKHSMDW